MIKKINTLVFLVVAFIFLSFTTSDNSKYKCMIQMSNYSGEGAYIVASIVDNLV